MLKPRTGLLRHRLASCPGRRHWHDVRWRSMALLQRWIWGCFLFFWGQWWLFVEPLDTLDAVHRRLEPWRSGQWHRWQPVERRSLAFVLVRCWGQFLGGLCQRLSCQRPDACSEVHRRRGRRDGFLRHRSTRGGCCRLGEPTGNHRVNRGHTGRWPIDHAAGLPARQRRRTGGRHGRLDGRRRGSASRSHSGTFDGTGHSL